MPRSGGAAPGAGRSCARAAIDSQGPEREVLRVEVILEEEHARKAGAVPQRIGPDRVEDDPSHHAIAAGNLNGQAIALQCGGTLVFDERGNLLSWFNKPGTEHITPDEAVKLRQKTRTKLQRAQLNDLCFERRLVPFVRERGVLIEQFGGFAAGVVRCITPAETAA